MLPTEWVVSVSALLGDSQTVPLWKDRGRRASEPKGATALSLRDEALLFSLVSEMWQFLFQWDRVSPGVWLEILDVGQRGMDDGGGKK